MLCKWGEKKAELAAAVLFVAFARIFTFKDSFKVISYIVFLALPS